MKKSLLAAALLGAFGVAHAQTAVTIYGNVDINVSKTTDKTMAIGKGDNNRLGFKGTEDLGNGLKALFQLEIRYDPDTGAVEGGNRPLFQGESRVGLQGDFGMVRLGRGLTPMQVANIPFEPWGYTPSRAGFATDLFVAGYSSDPLGPVGNSGNRFSNAIFYNAPVVGGFAFTGAMATKEANNNPAIAGLGTATLPQFPANSDAPKNPLSLTGTYTYGDFAIMGAFERNAVDTKFYTAAFSFMPLPALKLMANYSRQDQGFSRLSNADVTRAYVFGANYVMGAGKFLAGYGEKKPEGLRTTRQVSVGYEHSLSKRTYLYFDAQNKHIGAASTVSVVNFFDVGVHHKF
jgi:predicted porin